MTRPAKRPTKARTVYAECVRICEDVAETALASVLLNKWEAIAARGWALRCAKAITRRYAPVPATPRRRSR